MTVTKEALHPVRTAIQGYVADHPGSGMTEVGRAVGIAWGSLVHHVSVLQRAGLLTEVRDGRVRRLFPRDGTVPGERQKQAVAAAVTRAAIIAILRDTPDLDQTALAVRLGRSRRSLRDHLSKLVDAGIVEAHRADRRVQYRATWVP